MSRKRQIASQNDSERDAEHTKLLREARKRPGVAEAMEVYGRWAELERSTVSYRFVTQAPRNVITTNSSDSR